MSPLSIAGRRVERVNPAAGGPLGVRIADEIVTPCPHVDPSVNNRRAATDDFCSVAAPQFLAGRRVYRVDVPVERPDVNGPRHDRRRSLDGAAGPVPPAFLAGGGVDRV